MNTEVLSVWTTADSGAFEYMISGCLLPHIHTMPSKGSAEGAQYVTANGEGGTHQHKGRTSVPAQDADRKSHETYDERL